MKTQRLEKYSERFDNKDNELAEGIFNPDTWGKRLVEEPKQESQNLKNFKKLVSDEVSPAMKDFIKEQEILEEAAKEFANNSGITIYEEGINVEKKQGFRAGAKWQQERSYSEEDIKFAYQQGAKLALISQSSLALHKGEFPNPNKWFEQFKNK